MTKKPEYMQLTKKDVQALFDMVVNSLDFGSGFLDSDDVELVRRVAVDLGVDPIKATPSDFIRNYPHAYETYYWNGKFGSAPTRCRHCNRNRADHA